MFSVNLFCCFVFLSTVYSLDADPMQCYGQHEILDCVFLCPPEKTCRNRQIMFSCLQVKETCRPKCVCKKGYLRNSIGECIAEDNCDKCPGNNEYFSCGPECDNVCSELATQNKTNCPILNIQCNKKCYCEDGYARDGHGICIPIVKCPKVYKEDNHNSHQHNQHSRNEHHDHREHSNRVNRQTRREGHNNNERRCGHNEEYTTCKKLCPPETCMSIVARFKCDSREECKPGCVCKPGYLRKNKESQCRPIRECPELRNSPDFN